MPPPYCEYSAGNLYISGVYMAIYLVTAPAVAATRVLVPKESRDVKANHKAVRKDLLT